VEDTHTCDKAEFIVKKTKNTVFNPDKNLLRSRNPAPHLVPFLSEKLTD
jgi:hypothetical protein